MSTSNSHQEFKKGYNVPEGEKDFYHILFIDKHVVAKSIVEKTIVQKYAQNEWPKIKKNIDDFGIAITSHDEYSVLHDPTVKVAPKVEPKEEPIAEPEEVKEEPKKKPGRKPASDNSKE